MANKNSSPWPIKPIGALLDAVVDYRGKTPPKSSSGIPTLTAANIKNGRIDLSTVSFVSPETYEKWITRGLTQPGDVLITTEAPVGEVALLPGDQTYLITRRVIALRGKANELDNDFLMYSLLYSENRERLLSSVRGSTVPRVLKPDILGLEIPIPPFEEQIAIKSVLRAFDDKIELNRRMNTTLEAIARALFKSWFVDFDPVRANRGELDLSLPPDLLALFPDAFVESELGPIPAGWEVLPAGKAVKAVGGSTPYTKNDDYWENGVHYFATPKHLSDLSAPFLLETDRKVTDAGLAKISSGLLPIGTLLLSSRAPVGYLVLTATPVCINQGFIAMICSGPVSNYYMLNWTMSNMHIIEGRASGTTFAEISKRNFRKIPVLVPQSRAVTAFDGLVKPFYEMIKHNEIKSRTLTNLRDTLLPKLISGELRVPECTLGQD